MNAPYSLGGTPGRQMTPRELMIAQRRAAMEANNGSNYVFTDQGLLQVRPGEQLPPGVRVLAGPRMVDPNMSDAQRRNLALQRLRQEFPHSDPMGPYSQVPGSSHNPQTQPQPDSGVVQTPVGPLPVGGPGGSNYSPPSPGGSLGPGGGGPSNPNLPGTGPVGQPPQPPNPLPLNPTNPLPLTPGTQPPQSPGQGVQIPPGVFGIDNQLAAFGMMRGPNGEILPIMLKGGMSPYQSGGGLLGQAPGYSLPPNVSSLFGGSAGDPFTNPGAWIGAPTMPGTQPGQQPGQPPGQTPPYPGGPSQPAPGGPPGPGTGGGGGITDPGGNIIQMPGAIWGLL